ncbi:unnamed protein product [Vicia faba]|uniref:Uncharacterized protein n=1 Tax=Vicia faba TaxID=3906 RepID=A0AAV1B3X6_VICFA|nr:unnamed protein product [Vicia faba]
MVDEEVSSFENSNSCSRPIDCRWWDGKALFPLLLVMGMVILSILTWLMLPLLLDLTKRLSDKNKSFVEKKLNKLKREVELFGPQEVVNKYREYTDNEEDYL